MPVKARCQNLDMIVANDVKANGAGFGADTNIVTIFFRDGHKRELPIMSKLDVSFEILQEIAALSKQTGERT